MKTLSAFIIFLIFSSGQLYSQPAVDGRWNGSIYLQGEQLLFSVIFNTLNGETDGSIDFPDRSEFNLPVEVPVQTADSLVFTYNTGGDTVSFRAALSPGNSGQINGIYVQSGTELPFNMIREDAESSEVEEQELQIDAGTHQLSGTLTLPEERVSSSLIILVSGSGTETRDAAVAGFNLFEKLAEQLSGYGFATFRYDSRGTGSSTGTPDATFRELSNDLLTVSSHMLEETATDSLIFIGHGYGGTVSLMAAEEISPARMILLAPALLPGDEIINEQIRLMAGLQDIPENVVEENLQFQQRVNRAARTDAGWDSLEADIENRLRSQIEELPPRQRETLGEMDSFINTQVDRQLQGAKTRWYRSFISTDPAPLIEQQTFPLLVLFAGKDTEISPDPNRRVLENLGREVLHETLDDANHLFQDANSGMPGEYGVLDRNFTDSLLPQIVGFLLQVNRPNP